MPVRASSPRPNPEGDDFVGDGRFEQAPYHPLGPAAARNWSFGPNPDAEPHVPPPIEDAVLMAVAERIPWDGFAWDNPEEWRRTGWPRNTVAFLLWQLTRLDDYQIGLIIGGSTSMAYQGRKNCERAVQRYAQQRRPTSKQLVTYVERVFTAAERAEEIAECSLLWLDGCVQH